MWLIGVCEECADGSVEDVSLWECVGGSVHEVFVWECARSVLMGVWKMCL